MNRFKNDSGQVSGDAVKADAILARRLGTRIRLLRIEAGWSQVELAERLGVCREMAARYEKGLNCPRIDTLLRLCSLFGVLPERLFVGLVPDVVSPLPSVGLPSSRRETATARLVREGVRG